MIRKTEFHFLHDSYAEEHNDKAFYESACDAAIDGAIRRGGRMLNGEPLLSAAARACMGPFSLQVQYNLIDAIRTAVTAPEAAARLGCDGRAWLTAQAHAAVCAAEEEGLLLLRMEGLRTHFHMDIVLKYDVLDKILPELSAHSRFKALHLPDLQRRTEMWPFTRCHRIFGTQTPSLQAYERLLEAGYVPGFVCLLRSAPIARGMDSAERLRLARLFFRKLASEMLVGFFNIATSEMQQALCILHPDDESLPLRMHAETRDALDACTSIMEKRWYRTKGFLEPFCVAYRDEVVRAHNRYRRIVLLVLRRLARRHDLPPEILLMLVPKWIDDRPAVDDALAARIVALKD